MSKTGNDPQMTRRFVYKKSTFGNWWIFIALIKDISKKRVTQSI